MDTAPPEDLRVRMVEKILGRGDIVSPAVTAALRTVPRHLAGDVAGQVDPVAAYEPFEVMLRKRGPDGVATSSISAPYIQALQLEQAQLRPGHRVWEVGSGGVNAAYLAEVTGPGGLVVTMDIDPQITARAHRFLTATGYPQVQVITGDAAGGTCDGTCFDRILVTVETTDIPNAWWDQLTVDGIIVAAIRWRGQRRTVALRREGDTLVAEDLQQAGFVPLQGVGEFRETHVDLHDVPGQKVTLRIDDDVPVDAAGLSAALQGPTVTRWPGRRMGPQEWLGPMDMWAATLFDRVVSMTGDAGAGEAGLLPMKPHGIGWPVLVDGPSMAHRTQRLIDADRRLWDIGAIGYGPAADTLADQYAEAIHSWDPTVQPRLTVTRDRTAPADPGRTHRSVHRATSTLTISWP